MNVATFQIIAHFSLNKGICILELKHTSVVCGKDFTHIANIGEDIELTPSKIQ